MKRVLHMVGTMNMGGQETFIMNLYRQIDKEKIQFDFVVHSKEKGYYDNEIERLGGKIYRITPIGRNVWKHCKELYYILKENPDYIFHRHTCSSIVAIDLLVAKFAKIKRRIVHCHATQTTSHKCINLLFRTAMNCLATKKLACSNNAGIFLFGKNQRYEVIYNAIDIQKFIFNEEIREKIREKYNATDNSIIGHVGRFDKSKNHKFLLEIFQEILKIKKDAQLWLIGDGELKDFIINSAIERKIEKNIKFFGTVNNVNEFLMAMDIFVFPSIYEGLGIALIEAQCTGIKCVVSENIAEEAIITDNAEKLKLNNNPEEWAKRILSITSKERKIDVKSWKIQRYQIENSTKRMIEIYTELQMRKDIKK